MEDKNLANLTLPGTLFNRSEISNVSFLNSDLSFSFMCWNDFLDVDFSHGSLKSADLRSTLYKRVNFSYCDLSKADLRGSSFEECQFDNAIMDAAILTSDDPLKGMLNEHQIKQIDWRDDPGEEPPGG